MQSDNIIKEVRKRENSMNKKYYIQNMCWGWLYGGLLLYPSWNSEFNNKNILLVAIFYGIVFYPISKWAIEYFFLKFTSREFWHRGFFLDTPGKTGLLAIYDLALFLFSIPITLIIIITLLIKKLVLNKRHDK